MKSRVSIDVDHDNQPVIKIEHSQSEDVRDKLVKKFLSSFGGDSRWAEFYFTDNTGGQINSTALIRPLSIFELMSHQHNINYATDEHRKFLKSIGREVDIPASVTKEKEPPTQQELELEGILSLLDNSGQTAFLIGSKECNLLASVSLKWKKEYERQHMKLVQEIFEKSTNEKG